MTRINHRYLEKGEKSKRGDNIWYWTVLWGDYNQTAWYCCRNTHREQWNKLVSLEINPSLYGQFIQQMGQMHNMESKDPLQQMGLGELGSYMQYNETRSPTYTKHKNKFKVDKRLTQKSWHHKSPRGEYKQENLRCSMQQYFHQHVP